jgi:hypothetical protein
MDDKYLESEEKKEEQQEEQPQQEAAKPVFQERLRELEANLVSDFRVDLLEKAEQTIAYKDKQIAQLQKDAIGLRDEVALKCYVYLIKEVGDYPKAAADAYRAADAFLRVRENENIVNE